MQESVIGSVFAAPLSLVRSPHRRDRAVHHRHRARDGRSHAAPRSERSFPLGNPSAALRRRRMKHVLICGAGAVGLCSRALPARARLRGHGDRARRRRRRRLLVRQRRHDRAEPFHAARCAGRDRARPALAAGSRQSLLHPSAVRSGARRLDRALRAGSESRARGARWPGSARHAARQPRAVRAARRSLRQRVRPGQARLADAVSYARGPRGRDARRAPRARAGPASGDRFAGARGRYRSGHRHGDHRAPCSIRSTVISIRACSCAS